MKHELVTDIPINNFFTIKIPLTVDSVHNLLYNYGNLGENVFFSKTFVSSHPSTFD